MGSKNVLQTFILLIIVSLFPACSEKAKVASFTFSGMGTVLSVIYAGEKNEDAESALKQDAKTVESELSYYKDSSFVSKLNSEAYKKPIDVPPHVCKLIKQSLELGMLSDGFFDITYKSSGELWENSRDKIPDAKTIEEKQKFVGMDKVTVDCVQNKIGFSAKGVKIDLGGIAKGYAIDRAADILKSRGIENFIINYGGDMIVCGNKAGKPWSIGIKNPDNPSEILNKIEFDSGCRGVATSGDYERFFVIEGQTFSHIMDPKTGYPVKKSRSVTVIAENATLADVAATAVSVALNKKEVVEKIVEKFQVKIYTMQDGEAVLKEWRF